MKNNKLICVLLALLVCLSMVVSASATTESDLSFALETSSSVEALDAAVIDAGKTFVVNVVIESNPGVKLALAQVVFDTDVLELVSAESAANDVSVRTQSGMVFVNVGDTRAVFGTDKVSTTTGVVAKLTFKVLVETDVKTVIELKASQANTMDANGKFGEITVSGDTLNTNVVGSEHTCDETKTVEANNTAVDPTCTEAGKAADLVCDHCGKLVTEGATIAALGHTNGDVVVENNVDADCVTDGSYDNVVYCTVCEAEVSRETVTVPATGHSFGDFVITTEPGCGTFGVQTRTCSVCAATESDNKVPATGKHTFGDWKVTTEPTSENEGEETRVCSECGEKETRSVEKLPAAPESKDNTLLIVIIIVVVLAGAGVAAFFVLKNKKK